jgi:hypothetical protein
MSNVWCASCTKPIKGEIKVVKGSIRSQTFHMTPEDCANALDVTVVYKAWGINGRSHRITDKDHRFQAK